MQTVIERKTVISNKVILSCSVQFKTATMLILSTLKQIPVNERQNVICSKLFAIREVQVIVLRSKCDIMRIYAMYICVPMSACPSARMSVCLSICVCCWYLASHDDVIK